MSIAAPSRPGPLATVDISSGTVHGTRPIDGAEVDGVTIIECKFDGGSQLFPTAVTRASVIQLAIMAQRHLLV